MVESRFITLPSGIKQPFHHRLDGLIQRKCPFCEDEEIQPKSSMASRINMQPLEEEEEMMMPKLQMQPLEEEEEMVQPQIQMQPLSENGQKLQMKGISEISAPNVLIQRVPMPEESTVTSMGDYSEGQRQGIKYETGYEFQPLVDTYFQQGIVITVRDGYNVTYVVRGFPATEEWVGGALKAMALYNFNLNQGSTETPVENITTVQHLDLSGQSNPANDTVNGPNANIRFTSTGFDATGSGDARTQNVQLLIEKLSDFSATSSTETAEQRRERFATTFQITNAVPIQNDPLGDPLEAMSDSQFDQVLEALDQLPAGILSRVTGIPIHRSLSARGASGEVAEYNQSRAAGSSDWQRKITVYNDFFGMTAEQKAFTMIHEIGHALDYRPNEGSGGRGGASASATTGRGSFRRAVQQDGGLSRGVSTYGATASDYDEYYAEAFALFRSQPDTLNQLRPHVFAYFQTQFP